MKKALPLIFVLFSHTIYAQTKATDYSIEQIDSILNYYYSNAQYSEMLPFAEIGIEKATQQYGNKDTTYARMAFFLAFGYYINQDFEKSILYYNKAINIQKEKLANHLHYAESLNNLGALYYATSEFSLAEPLYKSSTKIRKELLGSKHPLYASSLNNLAILYYSMGNYAMAEPLYKEALEIKKVNLGPKNPNYASSLANLAVLYGELGNYTLAESFYKEADQTLMETLGEKHPYRLTVFNNLATLYEETQKYDLAEKIYTQLIVYLKETLGQQHVDYATALNNLGNLYLDLKNYAKAEPLFLEATKIRKKALGILHPDYASSLNNLAFLYDEMGKDQLAETMYKEALQIRKQVYSENHPKYTSSLINLAALYTNMGNSPLAWDYIQKSIITNTNQYISLNISKSWADSLVSQKYFSTPLAIHSLLLIYNLLDSIDLPSNNEKQVIITDLALQLLKKSRDEFSVESDKLEALTLSNDWVLRSLKVLNKNTQADKAFLLAEQSKSVLLMDAAKAEQAYNFGDLPDSLVQQELALQKQYVDYEASLAENRPTTEKDSLRSKLNDLNLEIKNFVTT